jgi:two-component system, LytTR family, response regulator
MRVIIADDESLARNKMRLMLSSEPGVEVLAECRNGADTLQAVRSYQPDLLFLDIRMPDLDGFEVLSQMHEAHSPPVVFTTAYDRHAVKAFEAHALDYLLKPFDQERLHQAVDRARKEMLRSRDQETAEHIVRYLSDSGMQLFTRNRRLIVKTAGRVVFLSFDEIDWVEAAANYVRIYVGRQGYLLRKGIGEIALRLDPAQFIRIHRSAIVNVQKIKELQPVNSGEYIVVLKDGKELPCSRGYRSGLQELVDRTL